MERRSNTYLDLWRLLVAPRRRQLGLLVAPRGLHLVGIFRNRPLSGRQTAGVTWQTRQEWLLAVQVLYMLVCTTLRTNIGSSSTEPGLFEEYSEEHLDRFRSVGTCPWAWRACMRA